ncbi:MAG TPA: TIGR02266 family protein [Myxococcales bacterium]|jgi:type IV pilus assembly protein PilZ|nr:TIGR02266 family protein [Myxococcales bacterium]
MTPPPERRTAPRGPIRLRVDYERMNAFFADYTKNISKGGTFIKTSRPLPVGTRFLFALAVPALAEPVTLDGEVTWVLKADGAGAGQDPGMGIRFVFGSAEQRKQFEALVERLMEESLGSYVTRGLLQET